MNLNDSTVETVLLAFSEASQRSIVDAQLKDTVICKINERWEAAKEEITDLRSQLSVQKKDYAKLSEQYNALGIECEKLRDEMSGKGPVRTIRCPIAFGIAETTIALPMEVFKRIAELRKNGQKISAIRALREYSGWGLKESKDAVDYEQWDIH